MRASQRRSGAAAGARRATAGARRTVLATLTDTEADIAVAPSPNASAAHAGDTGPASGSLLLALAGRASADAG